MAFTILVPTLRIITFRTYLQMIIQSFQRKAERIRTQDEVSTLFQDFKIKDRANRRIKSYNHELGKKVRKFKYRPLLVGTNLLDYLVTIAISSLKFLP
jgi:hypothetical protein